MKGHREEDRRLVLPSLFSVSSFLCCSGLCLHIEGILRYLVILGCLSMGVGGCRECFAYLLGTFTDLAGLFLRRRLKAVSLGSCLFYLLQKLDLQLSVGMREERLPSHLGSVSDSGCLTAFA